MYSKLGILKRMVFGWVAFYPNVSSIESFGKRLDMLREDMSPLMIDIPDLFYL